MVSQGVDKGYYRVLEWIFMLWGVLWSLERLIRLLDDFTSWFLYVFSFFFKWALQGLIVLYRS